MKTKAGYGFVVVALVCLHPATVWAQFVLTPTQLRSVPHSVKNFSVWMGDSTIALDVEASGAETIWTVPRFATNGSQVTTATFAHNPQWAPFSPNSGIPSDQINPMIPPTQSNAAGFLAYIELTSQGDQIFINGVGNQTPTNSVFANASINTTYGWSLDAANLVFAANSTTASVGNNLYTVAFGSTNGPVAIKACTSAFCQDPQWSPTDNVIAYDDDFNILLINPDGSGDHVIVDGNLVTEATGPVWAPSTGANIVFSCNHGTDICVATSDGVNPQNLTNGALGLVWSHPSWRVDENFIAAQGTSSSAPDGPGDLYVILATGGTPVALTTTGNVSNPAFSPLTDELFYVCTSQTPNSTGGFDDDLCVIAQPEGAGGVQPTCDATNCTGCCLQNICVSGATSTACGKGGAACSTCSSNEFCPSVTFTCTPQPCNSSTCPNGCCDGTGHCQAGTSTTACGFGGLQCSKCVGNQTCDSERVCVNNVCSSSTCIGCCDAQGKCQAGSSNAACGANGLTCVNCNGNETCSASHSCQPQGCTISNCPTGCCDVTGHCQPGNSSTSCGYSGFACMNCNGGVCDGNNHTCGAPSTCTTSNCVGCCGAADNQCHGGGTNAFCGMSGFTCQMCSTNQTCSFSAGFCE